MSDRNKEPDQMIPLWPDAGRMAGLKRGATYKAAARGDIPTKRIGNLLRVPRRKYRRMLGLED